jgi:hypothetical protein
MGEVAFCAITKPPTASTNITINIAFFIKSHDLHE